MPASAALALSLRWRSSDHYYSRRGLFIGTGIDPTARNTSLALRGNLGSIAGTSRNDIPADERFYAGGGGSIRGYGYQLAGPLDGENDPIGGRSLIELNGELRYRMSDTIGLVYFIDGGTVADSALPSLEERVFIGTGIGLRYITPIGPLRLDAGVPIDRRSDVDDMFQIYVSIGQAY